MDHCVAPKARKPSTRQATPRAPRAPEILAAKIKSRIVSGVLKEGDLLPAEGRMIEEFGVSRPTVREAYRILEAERLVSVARGARGGAVVHAPDPVLIANYTLMVLQAEKSTIDEIYLTLAMLEPPVVRVLTLGKSATAPEALVIALEQLERDIDDTHDFARAVTGFHNLLVDLSGNRPMMHLFAALRDVVERHHIRVSAARRAGQTPDDVRADVQVAIKSFHRVIALIASGDAEKAEAHWRRHWQKAYQSWVRGFEGRPIIELFQNGE
ncbi:MAG: GntR family transcriptional regulator [Spongiibacteraceae bacterium]